MSARLYKFHCTNDNQDYYIWSPEIYIGYTSAAIRSTQSWSTYGQYMSDFASLTGVNCDPEASWFVDSAIASQCRNMGMPGVFSVGSDTYKFVAENGNYFTVAKSSTGIYINIYKSDNTRIAALSSLSGYKCISMFSFCAGISNPNTGSDTLYGYQVKLNSNVFTWNNPAFYSQWMVFTYWDTGTSGGKYFWEGITPVLQDTDPYAPGGNTDADGGSGDFDDTSDPIDFPALPSVGAVDSGFITIFNPTLTEVKSLATYMWSNPLFDLTTWKKIFADPMDAILGLSLIPVTIPDAGTRAITVGNIATDVTMNVAAVQFIEIQCGSINVNEYWGAYLDYSPYTKVEIYLPYCGTHQLSIDDVMNKTVEVRYHVDILSGACCAYVKCGNSVLYTFLGQCSSSIPIAANDFTNVINGVLSAAVSIGSMVASGGITAPLAVPQLASTAVNSMKENVEKSGAISGTGGILAIQKPYLILTRPRQAVPANQNQYTGYPSFITSSLGDLSGYTEIEQIHLHDIPATGEEIAEIEQLLKTGVIL